MRCRIKNILLRNSSGNWLFLWRLPIQIHSKASITEKRQNLAEYLTRNSIRLRFVTTVLIISIMRLTYKDDWFHHKNFQALVTEIFKVKNDWVKKTQYDLQSESNHYTRRNVTANSYGLLLIKHPTPLIWELVPQSVRKCRALKNENIKSCKI